MSKRQNIMDSLLKAMFSTLFFRFMGDFSERMRNYLFDVIKPIIKKVILAIIGTSLVIIGILFACVSLVKYLSIYVSTWMAWGIVGLIILIVGIVLSSIGLRK